MLWGYEDFDAARHAGLATDEARAFESKNHLVDGGWSDAEAALDVGFGGRPQVHARIGVEEGQILALPGCEAGSLAARHLIHLSIRLGLQPGGCDECTLPCRVDPIRAHRTWGASEWRQAGGAKAQAGADPAGSRRGSDRRRGRRPRRGEWR